MTSRALSLIPSFLAGCAFVALVCTFVWRAF